MQFMARLDWANVLRYVHCDAIHGCGLRTEDIDPQWNGMGFVLFHEQDARQRHVGFQEVRSELDVEADGTLAVWVNPRGLVARKELLSDQTKTAESVKLVRIFKRLDGVSEEDGEQYWRLRHIPKSNALFYP